MVDKKTLQNNFPIHKFYLLTGGVLRREQVSYWLPQFSQQGLHAIQLREPDLNHTELLHHALKWQALAGSRGLIWWINGQPTTALCLNAGLHLPTRLLPPTADLVAKLKNIPAWSCAVHNEEGLVNAARWGADFALLAPIFATSSKPDRPNLGLKQLEKLAKKAYLPIIALGGITPDNANSCLQAGATGVAAISAVWDAPNPCKALSNFEKALGGSL